jgi:hypothetical protein
MGLKDFDKRKIISWRYSQVGTKQKSQTFVDGHSGTRVDGTRDLILEKFLSSPEESKPDASIYDLESNPPSPQSFEAEGYTVTGTRDKIEEVFLNSPQESKPDASGYDLESNPPVPQSFVDGHSGTTVTGTRDKIEEMFLNSPKESNPDASGYDLESNPPVPQSFVANGYTVTGTRNKIEEKFLDNPQNSKPDASIYDLESSTYPFTPPQSFVANGYTVTGIKNIISSKFVNDPKTLLIGDDTEFEPNVDDTPLNPLTQQQNYTITNTAGEYTITGLKGAKIPGWELQKGLSLILTNWSDMVDAKTLISYKVARVGKNATHGHLEIPYSYHNFGSTSVDAEPFSYGSLSPNIGWTVELGRGGNAVDGIVEDYEKILRSGDMYERFVQKQSDMQVMGTITIGSDKVFGFESPFDSFNSLDYLAAWGSTASPYRLGSVMQGVPRYSENTPMITQKTLGKKWGGFPLPGVGWYSDIDKWMKDGDAVNFNKSDGKDFHKDSKMLYLYKSFILTDPEEDVAFGSASWAKGFMTNYWNSIYDPYPIAPSMNIVQSMAWTDKNLVYGGSLDGKQKKYGTKGDEGSIVTDDLDKYDFFSKSGVTAKYLENSHQNEENMEAVNDIIDPWVGTPTKFREDGRLTFHQKGLRQAMKEAKIDKHSPTSVNQILAPGGEGLVNTLEKFSKDTRGLVNKYSTLGYSHLGNEILLKDGDAATKKINYERTLHSPSEINNLIGVDIGPEKDAKLNGEMQVESGVRFDGRKKVYGIGNQGMRTTFTADNKPSQLNPTPDIYGFKGYINKDAIGVFGDHVDKVNALPYGESNTDLDFVPLIFKDVYNKKDIQFRALFTEDITDTISPSWNPINYIGRTTAVYTYQNTARSIGFGFTIFPKTKQEFPILLEKVNYLVGMCYPNLDDYFRASGPLIKLTVGDIVKNQLGFLSECSVTFPSSESPWETDAGLQFTKKIDISIGFTYIGNNIPVAKGVHYNLDWLDGEHYTEAGVAWKTDADGKGGPTRKTAGTVSKLIMGGEQGIIKNAENSEFKYKD